MNFERAKDICLCRRRLRECGPAFCWGVAALILLGFESRPVYGQLKRERYQEP